jgi:hypothetical protein
MAADGSVAIALEGVSKGFGETRASQAPVRRLNSTVQIPSSWCQLRGENVLA